MLKTNEKIRADLIKHLKLGKPILNKKRKPIKDNTAFRYYIWLRLFDEYWQKPFTELTENDVDRFRLDLKNDKVLNHVRLTNGKDKGKIIEKRPYTMAYKENIENKGLKTLLNFIGKHELSLFSNNYTEQKEIPALSRDEVTTLANSVKLRDKVIFWVLFDGGFRAGEFCNIKFRDVMDDCLQSEGYYKIRITQSKTKPRTVGLTLTETTTILKEWLALNKDKVGTSKPLVKMTGNNLHLTISRHGRHFLKKRIFPHMLRHSSATYYCKYLSQYQMNKRYGWAMSSNMAARYIDAQGIDEEQINKKVIAEEGINYQKQINQLKEELTHQRDHNQLMQEQMEKLEKALKIIELYEKKK